MIKAISINYSDNTPSFGSASDITIKYAIEKRSNLLPDRVKQEITKRLNAGKDSLMKLYELHEDVYAPLQKTKTLEQAKALYPEFSDVLELTTIDGNRSIALKAVRKIMPLENFSLDLLKKLYSPESAEQIVSDYGFTNRNLLNWLMDKLNVKKLKGNYIQLLKMSTEEENSRIAEISRQAIYKNPEAQAKRQAKAAAHHRTPEYREKKRKEMINFYKNNPDRVEMVRKLSNLTWELCPEIKTALSEYTSHMPAYTKNILSKRAGGIKLSAQEKRTLCNYYKNFWAKNPEFKEIYSKARTQAAKELGLGKKSV